MAACFLRREEGYAVFTAGSGTHVFEARNPAGRLPRRIALTEILERFPE